MFGLLSVGKGLKRGFSTTVKTTDGELSYTVSKDWKGNINVKGDNVESQKRLDECI